MILQPLLKALSHLRRDRRGVTAIAFASAAVGVFGAAAIATDAGVWYSARRGAQNAADAAALAAAYTRAVSSADAARTAARDVAGRNGFPNAGTSTVTVNIPPASGANTANSAAVEVIVRQTQQLTAAGLFLGTPPIVQGRSVASLRDANNVCVLALTHPLQFGGNASIDAPNCVLAANRKDAAGVEDNGNSFAVRAFSISTTGSCPTCGSNNYQLTQRFAEWQPPVLNPFRHLDTKLLPSNNTASCINNVSANPLPWERNGRRLYCGNQFRVNGNDVVTLVPGTYYLWNTDIRLQGGTLRCPTCVNGAGVTIVLTGTPASIGDIDINGNAIVQGLRAPAAPADPDYRGVLIFRDGRASKTGIGSGGLPIKINGGAQTSLMGGLYFANAHAQVNGSSDMTACSVMVGASFEFTGNAGVSQCADVGTTVPQTRILVVAE